MKFGLMFFASSEEALLGDKYNLVIESAKFADHHGFYSIWTPERHFTKYGSLYPNPAILNAALARETQHIRLQAGSVVLPIHHPMRIVEEWSVVDNLSNGRVGISFASGWNPNDFVFVPEKFANRHQELFDGLDVIKKLWQGELITTTNGQGNQIKIRTYPTPIQPELPIWITAASNPQTFIKAGEIGANLLTHLLDQNIEELAEKIALYRQARAKNGYDPEMGIVSIMLHTFVGEDFEQVQEEVRVPYCEYLKSNIGLLKSLAQSRGSSIDIASLSNQDLDDFVNFLFERFATSRGLIGTPETCLYLLQQLDRIGVNEVACLLDFGPSNNLIISHLPYLNQLREKYNHNHQDVVKNEFSGNILTKNVLLGSSEKKIIKSENLTSKIKTIAEIQHRCPNQIKAQEYYQILDQKGLRLGSNFPGIENLWLGAGEVLAQIKLDIKTTQNQDLITIHPVLLEACHQVLGAIVWDEMVTNNEPAFYLVVGFQSFQIYEPLSNKVWIQAILTNGVNTADKSIQGDVYILNQDGKLLVEISGLQIQNFAYLSQEPLQNQIQNKYANWFYELQWQAKPLVKSDFKLNSTREPGSWIIFGDRLGIGNSLAQLLEIQGKTCFVVYSSQEKQIASAGEIIIDPADAQAMQQLIQQIGTSKVFRGIVHLWSLNTTPTEQTSISSLEQDWILTLISTLNLVKSLKQTNSSASPLIWLVTQGVQKIDLEDVPAITQAPIWGLGRSLATEIPHLWGGLIDIGREFSAHDAAKELFEQIYYQDEESQIALRCGQRFAARLVPSQKTKINTQTLNLHSQATYIITGGLGYLGLNAARWMIEKGARNIVLVGRKEAGTNAQEAIAQLEHLGANILVIQGDISIQQDIERIFAKIQQFYPPVKGIFHAAGVAGFHPLQNITPESLQSILAPKVLGTWNLHQMTLGMELDFFVCISSIASVWGSEGLANYAAASHFLDIFAYYRQSLKLPALTVNVGALSGGGMHHHQDFTQAEKLLAQMGLKYYSPEELLKNVEFCLETNTEQQIIIDIDWSIFKPLYELRKRRTLLQQIEVHLPKSTPKLATDREILQQLYQGSASQQHELLINYLQDKIAKFLKIKNSSKPTPEKNLMELGMDSLIALELRNNVQNDLGVEIPIITLIKGTTIANLATELNQLLQQQTTDINLVNQIAQQDNNWIEGEL